MTSRRPAPWRSTRSSPWKSSTFSRFANLRAASITWEGIKGTQPVLIAVAIVLVLQAVVTYAPFMNGLFETQPLSLMQLAQCTLPGIALLVILEIEKRIVGRFNLATDHARIAQQNP